MSDIKIELSSLEAAFEYLASKIGANTKRFWPAFCRKQWLDALPDLLMFVVAVVFGVILIPICFEYDGSGCDEYDRTAALAAVRLVGTGLGIWCIIQLGFLLNHIKYICNVEYWAMQDYVQTLSQLLHRK